MQNKSSGIVRLLVLISALLSIGALFLPIWRIELSAPQYPEGLVLQIYANGLRGDVAIINGLNHYIGMALLRTEDFIEFRMLPYIIGSIVLFGLIAALVNRRNVYFIFILYFLSIAIISMIDFYRWEYNYGHNLNPEAPIQVPGMAYQPPLIGFKQLLNFGAYSIPDTGGWLFFGAGLLAFIALIFLIKHKPKAKSVFMFLMVGCLVGCSAEVQPIKYGQDICEHCKMTIMDKQFAAELLNKNGKAFKFDDMICMLDYMQHKKEMTAYVADFKTGELTKASTMFFIKDAALKTPMGGSIAAFSNRSDAAAKYPSAKLMSWNELNSVTDAK